LFIQHLRAPAYCDTSVTLLRGKKFAALAPACHDGDVLLIYLVSFQKCKADPVVKEEEIASREFWMFVGALLFFIAALYITALTDSHLQ
jgi:hypothetical protein